MKKAVVFISHITEEREIAQALKSVVERAFLGLIDVFVSSDANSIKLGGKWLEHITSALKSCKVEIIIASPESVKRQWVNFEAGAGWVREIPVIPLCHSGMTPSTLPTPLRDLQAALATNEEQLSGLVPVLAEAIGSDRPTIDWSEFIQSVEKFETAFAAESAQIQKFEDQSPVLPTNGLLPHELATLLLFAENVGSMDDGFPVWQVRNEMESAGYSKLAATLAISSLTRKDLLLPCVVSDGYRNDDIPGAKITDDGWRWLDENKERLSLLQHRKEQEQESPIGGEVPF